MFRVNNGRQYRKRFSRNYVRNLRELEEAEQAHLRTFINNRYPKGRKHTHDVTIDSSFTVIPDIEFINHLFRSGYERIPKKYWELLSPK
jgi:hypothetical protein